MLTLPVAAKPLSHAKPRLRPPQTLPSTGPVPYGRRLMSTVPRTGVRWRIFFLLLLLVTVNYVDRASLSVALPVIIAKFHLAPAAQGLLLSAFFWTYSAMQIPGGLLPIGSSLAS
jgi:ACS family D-galactonate transporter-like MFS transporter